MLLDDFMPEYEFSERHERIVAAPKEVVRQAALDWRPEESLLWRALLRLRGLGSPGGGTLAGWAESMGFLRLAEDEGELVYGQAGQFWSLRERSALVSPQTVEQFRTLNDPRYAVAAFNIRVEALAPDRTRLTTETRVHPLGPSARRWFRIYWLLIRPFSGLLRSAMLRGIEARAVSEYRTGVESLRR
ncbi:MAG: hypothetical protein WEE64_09480 [Dehalococcoidia bacterium]